MEPRTQTQARRARNPRTASTRSPSPRLPTHERYTGGHRAEVRDMLGKRVARREAAFVLPFLRPGMRLLDCGCGPGSITVDLAALLQPGEVVGIDIHGAGLDGARRLAAERGLDSVRFCEASIYELPFDDGSFDAVFAHGVLYHLGRPESALLEMRRVLRPGGIIALRDYDGAGNIGWPAHPLDKRSSEIFHGLLRSAGGDPEFGRKHGALLRQAGFEDLVLGASFDVYATPVEIQAISRAALALWRDPRNAAAAIESKLTTSSELDAIVEHLEQWQHDPEAFYARARCEAVAFKSRDVHPMRGEGSAA